MIDTATETNMAAEALRAQRIADARAALDWIEANPEYPVNGSLGYHYTYAGLDKEQALRVARTFGTFEKQFESDRNLRIVKKFGTAQIVVEVNRSVFCRKVKDAVYECDPLFGPEEEAELDAGGVDHTNG